MTSQFPSLFSSIRLGTCEARNRIMRTATTTNLAEGGRVGPRMTAHYKTLARGGAGSIVTESFRVHSRGGIAPQALSLFDRDVIPSLQSLSRVVKAEGALLIAQVSHGGREHHSRRPPANLWGPSPIACPYSGGVPHEMTLANIEEIIDAFVSGAANAIEGECDGIEIHGAQGILIHSFLSPFSNQRSDRYGGSFDNRLRFAREIIERIRHRIGPAPILGFRLGVDEFTEGGLTVVDSERIATVLAADGFLDYLSTSQCNFTTLDTHLPDRHYPQTPYIAMQARIKRAAPELVVVGTTRIQTPEQAEEILKSGVVDMIGLTRALIVDPEWPLKAISGRSADIRRCIACNYCWDSIVEGGPIRCATNPTAGSENIFGRIHKAPIRRNVVVVGGGPGGLEVTRVAALRGHNVTLLEKSLELGGKIVSACQLPFHEEVKHVIDFLIPQVKKTSATVRTGVNATAGDILALHPDIVILATGATPYTPELRSDASVPVQTYAGPIDASQMAGSQIVIMDEDANWWGVSITESAARTGKSVTLVTRFFEPFREIPIVSRIPVLRSVDKQGVEMRANTVVDRIENGGVVLRQYQSGRETRIDDVAMVVWVGRQRSNDALASELQKLKSRNHRLVGDAYSPRNLPATLQEAHALGREI